MARLGQHGLVFFTRKTAFRGPGNRAIPGPEVEEDRGWLQGPAATCNVASVSERSAVTGANGLSRAEYEGDR